MIEHSKSCPALSIAWRIRRLQQQQAHMQLSQLHSQLAASTRALVCARQSLASAFKHVRAQQTRTFFVNVELLQQYSLALYGAQQCVDHCLQAEALSRVKCLCASAKLQALNAAESLLIKAQHRLEHVYFRQRLAAQAVDTMDAQRRLYAD